MTEFKPGDKVYYYNYGIVELTTSTFSRFPLKVMANGEFTFTSCGRRYFDDKYPSIIPLEEAERRGFVRKKVGYDKALRVKYYDRHVREYFITVGRYKNVEDFETDDDYSDGMFDSFVDDKLNECPPPKIEWEEI